MRWKKLAWTLALLFTFGLAGLLPAAATDLLHKPVPAGYGQERVINHYVYYPRYKHVYRINGATDPYAYQPEKRGYYPFYNSGYWRPAHEVRGKQRPQLTLPKYHQAWGQTRHDGHPQVPSNRHWHLNPFHW